MAATATIRVWWQAYFKQGYDRRVRLLGRDGVKVTDFTIDAWRALEHALTVNGYGPAQIVSTYYPKYIGTSTKWSLHSFSGCALDIDPAKNPFIRGTTWDFTRCLFTRKQVEAVLAIRTNSGAQVWRWGGDFGDYMHWQLNCKPADLATGIRPQEDDMKYFLQIFDKWTIDDLQAMKDAGYWGGDPAWYYGTEVTDKAKVNLVVHVLANGNKDIPGSALRVSTETVEVVKAVTVT